MSDEYKKLIHRMIDDMDETEDIRFLKQIYTIIKHHTEQKIKKNKG